MRHPPYRHHRKSRLPVLLFLAFTGFAAVFLYNKYFVFDDRAINEASLLKEKKFENNVIEIKTPRGITAWLMEDHSVPLVGIHLMFQRAGTAYDPEDKQGLASLAAQTMPLATSKYNRKQLADILELNGIKVGLSTGREEFYASVTTPSVHLQAAADILTDILNAPKFEKEDVKITRLQALEALKIKMEKPENRLRMRFNKDLFGNHPYARDNNGTSEGLNNIQKSDLIDFAKNSLARDNVIIGIAGDISAQSAGEILDRIFAAMPEHNLTKELAAPVLHLPEGKEHVEYNTSQIVSLFAVEGVARDSEDFYPLYIANEILGGGGLSSILSREAREKRGLTYGISTWLSPDPKAPVLYGYFSTSAQNIDKMFEVLNNEWGKFFSQGVSEKEFDLTKNFMLASFNLRFNSTAGIAAMLAEMQKYNLGIDFLQKRNDYVRAVTLDQVNAAAAKYFAKYPHILTLGKLESNMEQK